MPCFATEEQYLLVKNANNRFGKFAFAKTGQKNGKFVNVRGYTTPNQKLVVRETVGERNGEVMSKEYVYPLVKNNKHKPKMLKQKTKSPKSRQKSRQKRKSVRRRKTKKSYVAKRRSRKRHTKKNN